MVLKGVIRSKLIAALMMGAMMPATVHAEATAASAVAVAAEPGQIPLYGKLSRKDTANEIWSLRPGEGRSVRNVSAPTLTPFLPDPAKATGAAVIVAPGGGFTMLSMDHEGYNVARWLADRGIAAFVLKYRLLPTPVNEKEASKVMIGHITAALRDPAGAKLESPETTEDALAALRMVRGDAAKWGVDPARVGMIGFSAGAMTALNATLTAPRGQRPAFFGYVYGPQTGFNVPVNVPADAPPMFNAIAMDDILFPTMGFPIVESWKKARRPVELHAYQKGNHGFGGMGRPDTTTTMLMDEFYAWIAMQGFLKSPNKK